MDNVGMLSRQELNEAREDTNGVSIGTSDTQIGGDIPLGKIMTITDIICSNANAAAQILSIYAGHAASKEEETLAVLEIPKGAAEAAPTHIKANIKVRPDTVTGAGTINKNQCYMKMETEALVITIVKRFDDA